MPSITEDLHTALSNRLAALAVQENVDVEEKQISEAVRECASALCPLLRYRTQTWISDASLDLVEERRRAKLTDLEKYRRLNRELRRRLKNEREAHWNQVAADLEKAAAKHEYSTLYRTLRRLSGKTKATNDSIRKADGAFVRSDAERLQR